MTIQLSDGTTELQGSQADGKSVQSQTIEEKPSLASSSRPSSGMTFVQILPPVKMEGIDGISSMIKNSVVSPNANPTMFVPIQNAPSPMLPTTQLYPQPIPPLNFIDGVHFPGPLLWAQVQPIQPTKDPEEELRSVEEKRARSAAASARFRYNKKLKQEKATARVEALEQNIADLESRLREMEAEKEFYRFERDRFRDVVLRIPRLRHLAIPSARL